MPAIEEPNDEDEILSGSAAARTVTRDVSYGSSANKQNQRSATGVRKRGPRGRGSALERRLHDRPRPKRMRRAHVDLWQPRRARAIQECVLTLTSAAALALGDARRPSCQRLRQVKTLARA